jgi:hypothetical protein
LAGNESFDLGLGRRERQPVTERLADIQRGAPLAGEPPKPKTIQDISLETGVPWNVIETVVGDSGVAPEQSLVLAQDFAQKMKQEIDAGRDIPSAMRSIFGDDAPIEDALERAVALAGRGDEGRASSGQNNDNSFAEDFGRSLAGGAITGVGMIAEGAGTLLDVDDLFGDPGYTDFLEDAGRSVAATLQGWGQNVKDGMSDDAKRAIRNSTPKGKIFEPSTWEFEGDVSPQGITLLTADVLGSLAPVVIAGAFTGGVGGAVVGGLQGAGAGSQTGREIVNRASHDQLKESSGYYNELIAKGMKPEEAKAKVADAAGSLAAVFAAPVAGAGGAITGRIVQKGLPGLASKGLGTRVAGTAAVGALEEGVQEATEGYVARAGAELASGLPVDKMEGTFGEFVLGALGGGAFGAGRGLLPSRQEDQGDGTGQPLALPPPDPQLPRPDDGTGGSDPTARPPLGNLARAAQAAPKPVEPDAPRPTLNAQAGQSVRVVLGNGMQVDAEFVGEDEAGVSLKVNGEPALITRERMEQDGIQIEPVDVIGETAWANVETSPTMNFEPLDDTTEPPAKRAERLSGALDTYLSEQKIDATTQDRAEIANSIDRFGGTVEQAVADFMAEMQMEALAQESAAIAPVPQPGEALDQEPVKSETPTEQGASEVTPAQNQEPVKKLDGTAWGAMAPEQREALLVNVGFADRDGNLNAPGRRAAGKGWDALSERVREKLGERIEPQVQAGAPVAPGADPNRGLGQNDIPAIEAPEERPARTLPGVNVLPDGEEPIAMPGSVAAAATETEQQPTEGQKEAENYKTGKADWQGLKLSVENRKGTERSKKTPDGKTEWSVTMPAHYGRILRTKGADGDHVDFYMGDNEASENVWVIDQMDAETGRFDEHKVMLGFNDASQAGETYKAGFSDGKGAQRLGGIKKMTVADFKEWLANGDTTKPVTPKAARDDKDAQSRQDAPDTSEGGDLNAGIRNAEAEGQGGQEEVNSAPEQGGGEISSPPQESDIPPDNAADAVGFMDGLNTPSSTAKYEGVEYRIVLDRREQGKTGWKVAIKTYDPVSETEIKSPTNDAFTKEEAKEAALNRAFPPNETGAPPADEDPIRSAMRGTRRKPPIVHQGGEISMGDRVIPAARYKQFAQELADEGAITDDPVPTLQDQWWNILPKSRKAAKDLGLAKEDLGAIWASLPDLIGVVDAELMRRLDESQLSVFARRDGDRAKQEAEGAAREKILSDAGFTWVEGSAGDYSRTKNGQTQTIRMVTAGYALLDDKGQVVDESPDEAGIVEFADRVLAETGAQDTPPQTTGPRTKIEDFGEKIGGMRKDKARQYVDDLGAEIKPDGMSLAEAFPQPDYEALFANGIAPEIAGVVAILRNNIPRKPSGSRAYWQLQDWVRDVNAARAIAARILADPDFLTENGGSLAPALAKVEAIIKDISPNHQLSRNDLLFTQVLGRMLPEYFSQAVTKFRVRVNEMMREEKDYRDPFRDYTFELAQTVRKNRYRPIVTSGAMTAVARATFKDLPDIVSQAEVLASAKSGTRDEGKPFAAFAVDEIERILKAEAKERERDRRGADNGETDGLPEIPLSVGQRRYGGGGVIMTTKPRKLIVMDGFASATEARIYLKENPEELQKLARALRDGPNERLEVNRDREGPEWRENGRDATEADFIETLKFRGVAFGKSLTQKERQERMNQTFDAMMDMAGLLNLPVEALSLNGRLAVGFGTHGKGGKGHWAAVYMQSTDPATDQVIALTRQQGPGSLAHEWWHAIDNFLAREDAKDSDVSAAITGQKARNRTEFMSDRPRQRGALDQDVYEAFNNLRAKLNASSWKQRMEVFDNFSGKPYYGTTIELAARAFESKVVNELYQRDMVNDFLVNVDMAGGAYVRDTELRASGIDEALDGALSAVETVLRVKSKSGPKLPDKIADRAPKDIGVGFQWESLDGWQEVTDYSASRDEYTVKDLASGDTRTVFRQNLEQTVIKEQNENTPEGRARREAERKKAGAKAAAEEINAKNQEAKKSARDAYLAVYGDPNEWRDKARNDIERYARLTGKRQDVIEDRLSKVYRWTYAPGDGYPGGKESMSRGAKIIQYIEQFNATLDPDESHLSPARDAADTSGIWVKNFTKVGVDFIKWKQAEWAKLQAAKAQAAAAEQEATPENTDDIDVDGLLNDKLSEMEAEEADIEQDAEDIDVDDLLGDIFDEMEAEERGGDAAPTEETKIRDGFLDAFRASERFRTIVQARKRAAEFLDRDVSEADYTLIEEAIEAAIVLRARELVRAEGDSVSRYAELIDLYDAQPILSERTPEKMLNQAYSTPAPLAYLASRLAGIGAETRVVEPSAGNGMLLMEAEPQNTQANELQERRANQLSDILPGAVRQGDAMDMTAQPFDVLITNPPFGKVMEDQQARSKKTWALGDTGVKTQEIDHAMAYRFLEQMPEDGRAVLIVGSVKKNAADREAAYRERSKLTFYKTLYDNYNVVDHFTVSGDLYKKQGAAWPVDVIVIDGRAQSALDYPMSKAPAVLSTWAEVGRKLNDAPDVDTTGRGSDGTVGADGQAGAADSGAVPGQAGTEIQPDGAGNDTGGARGSGGVSGGSRSGTGGNAERPDGAAAGDQQPADNAGAAGGVPGQGGAGDAGADANAGDDGVSGRPAADGQVNPPRTAGEAFDSGVMKSGDALKDAGAAIKAILNTKIDPNKTGAMGAGFLQDVYEQLLPHLKSAWANVTGAATDFKDAVGLFLRAVRERMGLTTADLRELQPYLKEYVEAEKAEWGKDSKAPPKAKENTEAETDFQVAYQPRSGAKFQVGSLVPRAMAQAAQAALDKIEEKHGPVDVYAAKELGYKLDEMLGTDDAPGYFAAEQVDALAMAIFNVNQGKGFIIGDQTGIGKGRFVAAMLRHAEQKGKIPIFVTEKPGLYADMVRDMRDIGMNDAETAIIATNASLDAIPITGPDDTFSGGKPKERAALFRALRSGKLPEGARFVFTTYDQMNASGGRWPERAQAIRAAAPNAMIVMDESHNAGGTAGGRRGGPREPGSEPENRAEFFRDLVEMAAGTVFSSATYAKNPTTMSLYRSTNLSLAMPGGNMDGLGAAIEKGGVPLQQVIANAIAADGQYLRREKSFAGITFTSTHELGDDNPIKVERDQAVAISDVMGQIAMFDAEVMSGVRETFQQTLQAQGLMTGRDGFIGPDNISSTSDNPFASSFHNLVNQYLLAMKVEAVANMAVEKWRAGEKPIIGLMNVNSSIIDEYINENGIDQDGQPVDLNFTTIVDRYLERLRRIKVKRTDGTEFYYTMKDADMGSTAVAELKRVRDMIYALPIDKMPGSPVDAIMDQMRAAGMNVDEITGRSLTVAGGVRSSRKSSQGENKRRMNEYNSGALDGLIISASGATGFSMHATDKPGNDGKKRHMIIAQPHADINVFMQMLGRVNRTGQIVLPEYTLAVSNLSLEKRVAAVLMKKMASLNANTTAAKRGATSLSAEADFINQVGDLVVRRYLRENKDLAIRTGLVEGADSPIPDIAKKLTGRFAFLHPDEVDRHYASIGEAFTDLMQQLDAEGRNPLEAKTLDLDARTLRTFVLSEGQGTESVLDEDLALNLMSVKRPGSPYPPATVKEMITAGLGGKSTDEWHAALSEELEAKMPGYQAQLEGEKAERERAVAAAREASEAAKAAYDEAKRLADEKKAAYDGARQGSDEAAQEATKEAYAVADKTAAQANRHYDKTVSDIAKAQTLVENVEERLSRQKNNMREVLAALKRVAPGTTYTISGETLDAPAVVVSVDASKQGANPTAAGQIRVRFALADNSREIAFSLSQLMSGVGEIVARQDLGLDWEPFFAAGQSVSREDRWMATGNLIAGVDRFSRSSGQVVIYTDSTGEQRTGLLMPRTFDPGAEMANEDVPFPDAATATQFVTQYPAILKTADKNVTFQQDGSDFKIRVGRTRGRAYFLLQAVQPLIRNFRAKGNAYVGAIPRDNLEAVLKAYSDNLGVAYVADNYKEAAREITGQEIPEFGTEGSNLRASLAKPQAKRADFDAAAGDVITSAPEARKAMRAVRRALRDELAKFGIGSRITLDVREGVIDTFPGLPPMDGYFLDGVIGIAADTPGGYMGVLRHEVIHALRNRELWGNDHGLFTAQEWRTLVRAARQNTRLMDQVNADYEGLSDADKIEEVIAEMFREWMETRDTQTPLGRAFDKLRQILDAIVTALRGEGLNDAAAVFDRIRSGDVGGRGPDGPGRGAPVTNVTGRDSASQVRAKIATPRDAGRISVQARNLRSGLSQLASDAVTNAMKDRGGYNTLALVPGRALFNELGKGIPAAKRYLRLKEKMDTKRNDKHAETDVVAQNWRKLTNQNPEANAELMKLMHDSTIAGVDPSERFVSPMEPRDALIIKSGRVANPIAYEAAVERKERHERLQKAHDDLAPRFKALPEGFQELYRDVRDTYRRLDDEQTAAILGNVERAMTLAIRRAEREHRRVTETARENYAGALRRIGADTALSGTERTTQRAQAKMKLDQAIADADEALAKAKATRSWTKDSQVRKLRAQFETNKLSGPYFPLARFGEYFVLARDDEGNVQSFSRHETVQQQRAAQKDMEDEGFSVQIGVMQETDARDLVDPAFVADIERMLEEVNADEKLMDDIWQRWLESLPDMSIRKHRIHRKNREGYDADALRAFGHHMFHGSHQLARLLYSLEMQEELDVASEEAAASDDPVRKGFIVNEMKRRHGFTMNPKGAWWASRATSLAFVYYLSVSPAAAIVNLSQTSIVGTSVLGRFGGTKKAAGALTQALADFTRSPNWHTERNTKNLSADERQAMHEAYKRGVIDRTQSHDLAQVAESGVEYNAKWVNVMSKISWLFHHSERMNREVTFLAGYRLLREQGKTHDQAITQAGDATWEVHFDYQNCVDGDTEILTTAGWKRYDQVKKGDIAISADDLGHAVETEIEDVNVFNTRQKIKLFTAKGGRNFSMAVTDEHTNMVVQQKKRGGKIVWGEPEMVKTKDLKPSHNILRSPVAPLEREGGEYGVEFARLLGWIAAEGWYSKNRGATQKHAVRIEQSLVHNPDYVEEIQNMLDALGAQYSRHKVKNDRHILWSITGDVNKRVREAMPDKLLTWEMVAKMSAGEMSAVLDAFAKADGTKRGKNACITIEQKRSTNFQNIDVMQAMCACIGKSASVSHGGTRDTSWLMHPGNGKIQNRKTNVGLLNVERIEVPLVWCPTTGTGRWIARRNGHFFITGNTSKPRVMQSPGMQVLLTFRNFSVNFLWRIFRDLHQSVNGADQETRKEARRQAGVMATMMLFHAGIKGVYGYGLVMALMGLFFPDDEDDPEERLEKLMLDYLPRPVARAMLDGVPGTLGGIDLTGRIGMPNLWFRDSLRPLEGADLYQHYVNEVIGPIPAIGMNIATGASRVIDGAALRDGSLVWRGVETAMPKAVRDVMKGGRYAYEGALTYNGDPIKDDFSAWEVIAQVSGFTPKELVDQYDQNGRLKNKERAITDRRRNVIKQAAEQIKAGDPLTPRQLRLIEEFNRDYPEWPITNATLNSSVQGRINRSERNEAGVSVNPRLEPRLRASLSPLVADG